MPADQFFKRRQLAGLRAVNQFGVSGRCCHPFAILPEVTPSVNGHRHNNKVGENYWSNSRFRRLEQADGFFGAEIGQEADRAAGIEGGAFDFVDAHIAAEIPEIEN